MPITTIKDAMDQALQLQNAGRFGEAESIYRQVIQKRSDIAEVHYALGVLLQRLHRLDEAVTCYERALEIKPDYASALSNLCVAYENLGRLGEAVAAGKRAVHLQPQSAMAHNNLGVALRANGNLDEAISAYRKAIQLNPKYLEAFHNLGNALEEAGIITEAVAAFQEAGRLRPSVADYPFHVASLTGTGATSAAPLTYLTSLFDGYAETFDQKMEDLQCHIPQLLFKAVTKVAGKNQLDILDIGCGTGLVGKLFRDHAKTMEGVDLSKRMIAKARARVVYDRLQVGAMLASLQSREDSLDLVISADVFPYIGDLRPVFAAAFKALRNHGLFAFSVEEFNGADFFLQSTRRYAHSSAYLQRLARENSFKVISVERAVLRLQKGQAVDGLIVVLRKEQAGSALDT